jgi:hypothetical protein
MRVARTNAEAHLYMDLHPCACGEHRFERKSAVVNHGDDLMSHYTGSCARCGAPRSFQFGLPPRILMPQAGRVTYGGPEASELLDPGQWIAVSDAHARRAPASPVDVDARRAARHELDIAVAALEEVLKFLGPGVERVPPAAFTTPQGRAVHDAEPGRFSRLRLEAVLGAYRELRQQYVDA